MSKIVHTKRYKLRASCARPLQPVCERFGAKIHKWAAMIEIKNAMRVIHVPAAREMPIHEHKETIRPFWWIALSFTNFKIGMRHIVARQYVASRYLQRMPVVDQSEYAARERLVVAVRTS